MLATAIAPELLISKNWGDLIDIKADIGELTALAKEDGVPWSRTHSLFANMGGFVIRGNAPERVGNLEDLREVTLVELQPDRISQIQTASKVPEAQESSIEKTSIDLERVPKQRSSSSMHSNPYHLIASDLIALRQAGFLKRLPYIPTSELNDKNKSDSLVRFIAIIQILWIVIQIIVRASRHLAISQLEIAVVAFSICAITIYCLNWEKPKGVQVPYTLLQYSEDIPQLVLERVGVERKSSEPILHGILESTSFVLTLGNRGFPDNIPGAPIRNHFTAGKQSAESNTGQTAGLLIGGMMFGALHVAAWDFVFPTFVERKMWWAASVICTFTLIFLLLLLAFGDSFIWWWVMRWSLKFVFMALVLLYIPARLFLLVEIFRTLLFLPPSAYVSTWAANVPHIA